MSGTPTSVLRTVLLVGAVCIVLAGLASLVLGLTTLARSSGEVELTVTEQPVAVPTAGLFGGSTMVYAGAQVDQGPRELGCELVDDRGTAQSQTRLDQLSHALGDPLTVDGVTWYPLTEVSLASRPATLSCPAIPGQLAVADGGTFGGDSRMIGAFATGTGLLFFLLGAVGVGVLGLAGRRRRGWSS